MSSVVLYLAIVVMWLCVLVPMWLRRDRGTFDEFHDVAEPYVQDEQPAEAEGPGAAPEGELRSEPGDGPEPDAGPETGPQLKPVPGRAERRRAELRRRAKIVAKRRRLTFWCVLLLLASVVTAAVRVIPWWGAAPSAVLLGAYLSVLRVSVRVDAERRRAAARARAERARLARRRAAERAAREAMRPVAEVIEIAAARDEIFDQYAEPPARAVGD
ncbi:hypothetical protein [Planomonospora venezuelensis]|uniref:Uncharacterized protein n=1 Tax=Planomonospora venezuelensis TaxID=1999 RepID=A0A841D5D8_PLAVE|nr:hypothetical protein [Planomonospora venezuelensis]MBB5962666.1 hypothetical protein [Planomonospora venezuelensis]GIN01602.1 hypothetical protein Pve01_32600 [Planomonospora venezuelensis]